MNIGNKIRGICNYMETVPGDQYDFMQTLIVHEHIGGGCCVLAHAAKAGLVSRNYKDALDELQVTAKEFAWDVIGCEGTYAGETSKQAAIANMRAYADDKYPVKVHTGLPVSVQQIFEPEISDVETN